MMKEDKVLQQIRSDLRQAKKFWFPIFRQAWHNAWTLWLWIFVVPLAVNVVGAVIFIINNGWQALLSEIDIFFIYYVLGFIIVLVVIYFYFSITSSAVLFFEQKEKADLYTTNGIEVVAFESAEDDVRPEGILVKNKKGKPIKCSASLSALWRDKKPSPIEGLPDGLGWYDDTLSNPQFGYKVIDEEPVLFVLRQIHKDYPPGAILITAPARSWEAQLGEVFSVPTASKLPVKIIEGQNDQIEVRFLFEVEGVNLKPSPLLFSLFYDGKRLAVKKLNNWENSTA